MYFCSKENFSCSSALCQSTENQKGLVSFTGLIESVRQLGQVIFVTLRTVEGRLQVVLEGTLMEHPPMVGSYSQFSGQLRTEKRAPLGKELVATSFKIQSEPKTAAACSLAKPLKLSLENELAERILTVRHYENWCRFKIQAALAAGFRYSLDNLAFTEIFTPKLAGTSGEGGSNVFELNYFGQKATLAQSPQLYKQIMVGVYGRVFEIGHVYRAEEHDTARHLNEYVSLDWETGFVTNLVHLINLHALVIGGMFEFVRANCQKELGVLKASVPNADKIPVLSLEEAKEILAEAGYLGQCNGGDLCHAEEKALGAEVKRLFGSELFFITGYHASERPFYALEETERPGRTESFDLVFWGQEITTGGLRIHCPKILREKMLARGMNLEPFNGYLSAFDHGLPPHGGSGTGLERLTALLTGANNIRRGSLFPRDRSRLNP